MDTALAVARQRGEVQKDRRLVQVARSNAIINVGDLEMFDAGTQVAPEQLVERHLMSPTEGRGLVKVLGDGEVDRALTVRAHKFSASARVKIEAAGGTVEIIPTKVYEKTKRRKDEKTKTPVNQGTGE